jgi:hypothetical protein
LQKLSDSKKNNLVWLWYVQNFQIQTRPIRRVYLFYRFKLIKNRIKINS